MHSLKDYRKLHLKKYRQKWGLFVAEGKRLCRDALQSGWQIQAAFMTPDFMRDPEWPDFQEKLAEHHIPVTALQDKDFRKLADTENPQGILFIIRINPATTESEYAKAAGSLILLLDGIRDPGNMGTIIRTADWFGIPLILSSSESVDFFNQKTVRASMGSVFRLTCHETPDLRQTILHLKNNGFSVIGTSPSASRTLQDLKIQLPVALVLGGEAEGITPEVQGILDFTVMIPRRGEAESLNVSVAAGILLHELVKIQST
jgi:TrmH family RNA methyltransferase